MKKSIIIAIIMACLAMNIFAQTEKREGFPLNGTYSMYMIDGTPKEQCVQIAKALMRGTNPDIKLLEEGLLILDTADQEVRTFKQWGETLITLSKAPVEISGERFAKFKQQSESYTTVTRLPIEQMEIWQIGNVLYFVCSKPFDGDPQKGVLIKTISLCQCGNDLR